MTARCIWVVGKTARDVRQICAQLTPHHEVKGGVEHGRQDIFRRADLAAAAALKILRDAIPVIVGIAVLVLIEKERIEQGFVLRIERLASCFQFFQIGGHFLVGQTVVDHCVPPYHMRPASIVKRTKVISSFSCRVTGLSSAPSTSAPFTKIR